MICKAKHFYAKGYYTMKKILSLCLAIGVLCAAAAVFASCGDKPAPIEGTTTNDTQNTAETSSDATIPVTRTFSSPDIIDSLDYKFYAHLIRDNDNNITSVAVQEWKKADEVIVIPSEYVYDGKTYSVTMLGYYSTLVKNDPTGVKEVVVPASVKTISQKVFSNFTSLEKVTLSEGLETIENHAFWKCSSLSEIVIPSTVKSIGASAFANCTSLTSLVIPNSVTEIDALAFAGCTGLKTVTLPKAYESQINSIFSGIADVSFIFS